MQCIRLAMLGMAIAFPIAGYAQTGVPVTRSLRDGVEAGTAAKSAEPFKVGTFRIGTTQTIGIVLRDALVVDVVQANAALEKSRSFPARRMPSEMVEFIADYENGLKGRVYAIVNELVQSKTLESKPPAYVRKLSEVKTLAPIPRPRQIMMTAVNFYSHIAENAPPDARSRRRSRHAKPTAASPTCFSNRHLRSSARETPS